MLAEGGLPGVAGPKLGWRHPGSGGCTQRQTAWNRKHCHLTKQKSKESAQQRSIRFRRVSRYEIRTHLQQLVPQSRGLLCEKRSYSIWAGSGKGPIGKTAVSPEIDLGILNGCSAQTKVVEGCMCESE